MATKIYARVSTEQQSLDRQREKTFEYVQDKLEADITEAEMYNDKSTGTNTDRAAYRQLKDDVSTGDVVVVDSLSRLSRSLQDLQQSVEEIVYERGAELHFVDERLQFRDDGEDPFQTLQLQLLGAFAEFEASIRQQRAREGIEARMNSEDYHHGRTPIGFQKEDGHLYKADNFEEVRAVLEMVKLDGLSKRKAANQLGCARATIRNALEERADLYELSQNSKNTVN
jgi:DNA invertase Pin-like site-specific DNA recombinase